MFYEKLEQKATNYQLYKNSVDASFKAQEIPTIITSVNYVIPDSTLKLHLFLKILKSLKKDKAMQIPKTIKFEIKLCLQMKNIVLL